MTTLSSRYGNGFAVPTQQAVGLKIHRSTHAPRSVVRDSVQFGGQSPLEKECSKAISQGDMNQIKNLVAQGLDLKPKINEWLKDAATWGNADLIHYFVAQGGDVNAKTQDDYQTPILFSAVDSGREENVKAVLSHKADINITNKEGETALMNAVYLNQPNMVELLLKEGAKPNVKDKHWQTALDWGSYERTFPPTKPEVRAALKRYGGKKSNILLFLARGVYEGYRDLFQDLFSRKKK